ncbi:MAG: type II CAAX endopeptidase family protein [Acidobacteriota bacterium]|nr:type II CAAX endopeptidase family protein [Acidobacteriota bacterium]MDQ7087224.1 type II CAAX endopeptidase family protein [Acidobacteriota bacterium]
MTGSPRLPDLPARPFDPPWGMAGTLLGLGATFCLAITVAVTLEAARTLAGVDPEALPSLPWRYAQVLGFQLTLVAVPLLFVRFTGATLQTLGLGPLRRRHAAEAIPVGCGLSLLTIAYGSALARWAPAAFAEMIEEQRLQLEFLEAPWFVLLPVALLCAPLAEEIFFRGFLFGGLRNPLGFALASGLTAALFTLVHWMKWSTPILFFIGLCSAALAQRHRSLWPAIFMHVAFNASELLLDTLGVG